MSQHCTMIETYSNKSITRFLCCFLVTFSSSTSLRQEYSRFQPSFK
uniref:Uncharacterized protein n=1 Tax=Anguilla anguilla TaxID=7936 RepID=A0A0E9UW23_ANGAN